MSTIEDPTLSAEARIRLGLALQGAGQKLIAGVDADADSDVLLDHLRALRVFFDAVDAGNESQSKPAGPLRPYRIAVFHRLADLRVPREQIADAAGISTNAVGVAFKGQRRGRHRAASNGDTPERPRRPRPT